MIFTMLSRIVLLSPLMYCVSISCESILNVSSISFDNNHLKRVNHKLQQVEESCIDKENTTEIKIGYNEKEV